MNKKGLNTYIDFGSSRIRIGVFDLESSKNIFTSEKDCISNFNEKYFDILYLCNKFMTLVNKVKPNTYKVIKDHPRLIIPFFDTTGKLFAFQGRAFGKEQPKYLTVKLDEKKQKIFGLERVNFTQEVKIVEGPIDSFFISNCVAAAGADLFLNNKISLHEN